MAESEYDSGSDSDSGDDTLSRKDMLEQISSYHRYFPEIVKGKKGKKKDEEDIAHKYVGKSDETVRKDLEKIKADVSGANMIKDVGGYLLLGTIPIQNVGTWAGLKLDGPKVSLTGTVMKNQDTYNCYIKELMCKYGAERYSEPEYRLLMTLGAHCLAVHSANSEEQQKIPDDKKKPDGPDQHNKTT